MSNKLLIIYLFTFLLLFGCKSPSRQEKSPDENKSKTQIAASTNSALQLYNLEDENASSIKLPDEISEISGIAVTENDRLFCHGDEDADIFQIDMKSGQVIKKFYVGETSVNGDFEDIAIAGDRFFLVESKGIIVEFKEGNDGEHVPYIVYKTFLKSSNNVEGLCYDPEINSLLLACKDYPGKGFEKNKAVYYLFLNTMTLYEKPKFLIPLKDIRKNTIENEFSPSGIARHPKTGSFFVIAARGNAIIEVSKEGEIIAQKDLPEKVHKQPEGIAITKDGTLFISNEGRFKTARLISYPMRSGNN